MKHLRDMDNHVSDLLQDYVSEPPHRGLTIVPADEVNPTEDRVELTLAHSKPETERVYDGSRHYKGK